MRIGAARSPDQQPCNASTDCAIMLLLALGWCIGVAAPRVRAETPSAEYEVKAGFLFHFPHFVEWPETAFPNAEAPICIGILGEDPFGPLLDQLVQGESVRNRKLIVKRSEKVDDLRACQILFISRSAKNQIPQILNALGDAPVLTVGETEGFASRGGIINFYIQDNRVRFEINPDAARRHGLRISSKLLSLGKIVR